METGDNGPDTARPPGKLNRVAISVFRYFPQGGIQMKLFNLAEELVSRKIEVVIYCISCDQAENIPGVSFCELPAKGFSRSAKARHFEKLLQKELAEKQFDLHIAFSKVAGADWYFTDSMPFAKHDHSLKWWQKLMPWYRTFANMERSVFAQESKTRIICFAPFQQQEFQKLYDTQAERIFILPPGIDEEYRHALNFRVQRRSKCRKLLRANENSIVLLTVASAPRTKGVDRAIAALASLPPAEKRKSCLVVAGWGDMSRFKLLARKFGVENKVIFAGWQDDIETFYAGADLLIHPARRETSGAVLLESIACGTPVLCSGNCGFADSVENSGGEVLPHPFRQKNLNRTLLLLLSVPGKLEELQCAAAEYASSVDFYRRSEAIADLLERSFNDEPEVHTF